MMPHYLELIDKEIRPIEQELSIIREHDLTGIDDIDKQVLKQYQPKKIKK